MSDDPPVIDYEFYLPWVLEVIAEALRLPEPEKHFYFCEMPEEMLSRVTRKAMVDFINSTGAKVGVRLEVRTKYQRVFITHVPARRNKPHTEVPVTGTPAKESP